MSAPQFLGVLLCVSTFWGCSGEAIVPVTGKVTLSDGRPLEGATVVFDNSEKNISASGTTNSEGIYQLTTRQTNDGALLGNYKVAVHQPSPKDSSQGEGPRLFPRRYENPEQSGLEFTVNKEQNQFDIELQK